MVSFSRCQAHAGGNRGTPSITFFIAPETALITQVKYIWSDLASWAGNWWSDFWFVMVSIKVLLWYDEHFYYLTIRKHVIDANIQLIIEEKTRANHVTHNSFFLMLIALCPNVTVPCSLKSPRCHIIWSTVYLSRRFLPVLGSGDCDGF